MVSIIIFRVIIVSPLSRLDCADATAGINHYKILIASRTHQVVQKLLNTQTIFDKDRSLAKSGQLGRGSLKVMRTQTGWNQGGNVRTISCYSFREQSDRKKCCNHLESSVV